MLPVPVLNIVHVALGLLIFLFFHQFFSEVGEIACEKSRCYDTTNIPGNVWESDDLWCPFHPKIPSKLPALSLHQHLCLVRGKV